MNRSLVLLLGTALLANAASAQQTFIVDPNNGPGTDFTTLPTAVASVADGDRLILREGSYTGVTVTASLSLLGDIGARIVSPGANGEGIRLLGAGAQCTLRNLVLDVSTTGPSLEIDGLDVALLENVTILRGLSTISNCNSAHVFRGRFRTMTLSSSFVAISDGVFQGLDGVTSGRAGIEQSSGELWVSRCRVVAGVDSRFTAPAPALIVDGRAVVTDDGSGYLLPGLGLAPGITGSGTVVLDPRVTILSSQRVQGPTEIRRNVPSLSVSGGPLGGGFGLILSGAAHDAFLLAFGIPAAPTHLGPFGGELALDPNTMVLWGGQLDENGYHQLGFRIPNDPLLFALLFGWQALSGDSPWTAQLSNPVVYTHAN